MSTRLGIVAARYNEPVTEPMRTDAEAAAAENEEVELVDVVEIPGAYDSPLAADRLARREDIDAVVVVGAIVTGDTDHDQVIGEAAANRLSAISVDRDTPITLGVTGPGMSGAEARERTHKGAEAVDAAVELVEAFS